MYCGCFAGKKKSAFCSVLSGECGGAGFISVAVQLSDLQGATPSHHYGSYLELISSHGWNLDCKPNAHYLGRQ